MVWACVVTAVITAVILSVIGWDLSTVDGQGGKFRNYGDVLDGTQLLIVLSSVGLVTLVGRAVNRWFGRVAAPVGGATAVVFVSWRAASARVVGANMWGLAAVDLLVGGVIFATARYLGVTVLHRGLAHAKAKRHRRVAS